MCPSFVMSRLVQFIPPPSTVLARILKSVRLFHHKPSSEILLSFPLRVCGVRSVKPVLLLVRVTGPYPTRSCGPLDPPSSLHLPCHRLLRLPQTSRSSVPRHGSILTPKMRHTVFSVTPKVRLLPGLNWVYNSPS